MKIIFGLGNPESKYDNTYHNVGFSFVDYVAQKLKMEFKKRTQKSLIAEKILDKQEIFRIFGIKRFSSEKEKIVLVKPLTYMNLSGESVNAICKKFKLPKEDFAIVYDDVDLPVGDIRYREKGSAGTHNGMRNIIQILKIEDFKRLRIGIGNDKKLALCDYVLSKINPENESKIQLARENGAKKLFEEMLK